MAGCVGDRLRHMEHGDLGRRVPAKVNRPVIEPLCILESCSCKEMYKRRIYAHMVILSE